MTINIQFGRVPFSETLTEYVISKLNRLGSSYRVNKAQVFFKKVNAAAGKDKICEMRLDLSGKGITAVSSESSFEKALRETAENIEKLLITKAAPTTGDLLVEA